MHRVALVSAAVIGAPAAALLVTIAATTLMPGPPDVRLLTAMLAVFPAMAAGACLVVWRRDGVRAWVACLGLCALALVIHRLGRG